MKGYSLDDFIYLYNRNYNIHKVCMAKNAAFNFYLNLFCQEIDPFSPNQSMLVSYVGIEFENIGNETFYDCRGYNCGISKFKGMPSMDVKRNFEERWQKLSNNKDIIIPDLYLARYI